MKSEARAAGNGYVKRERSTTTPPSSSAMLDRRPTKAAVKREFASELVAELSHGLGDGLGSDTGPGLAAGVAGGAGEHGADTVVAERGSAEQSLIEMKPTESSTGMQRADATGRHGAVGGAPAGGGAHAITVSDFMTDGSIARLCDEMSKLTGVPIWLRGVDGRVVVPTPAQGNGPGGGVGLPLWQIVPADEGIARAYALVGKAAPQPGAKFDLFIAPLKTSLGDIGDIALPADWGKDDPRERRALERAATILAGSAAESCQGQIDLRTKLDELGALFRLSSLLVQQTNPDHVVNTALDTAIEVLGFDAGSISVLDEAGELVHKASRNLSPHWLATSAPMSIDGTLRARALNGEVVSVEDIASDKRIANPERAADENVASLMTAGLLYQGRASGLIRLYSRVARHFTPEQAELLRAIADHVAMVLAHSRLRELREQDHAMQRQVKLAADVQRRMLPRSIPQLPGLDTAARYAPSFQLGGDFYDTEVINGSLAFAVGDVVGKGVPAAMIMSAVRAALRAYSQTAPTLSDLLSKVNLATLRDTMESEFVTLWVGLLDPTTKQLVCASAGHDPAMLFRPDPDGSLGGLAGFKIEDLGVPGLVAGVDPETHYEETTYQLRAGDVLLTCTDGIGEAMNFDGKKFGRQRLIDTVTGLLRLEAGASSQRIIEHVMWTLRQYSGLALGNDDVTIVVVRVS